MKAAEALEKTKTSDLRNILFEIRKEADDGNTSITLSGINNKIKANLEGLGYMITHDKSDGITIDWSTPTNI